LATWQEWMGHEIIEMPGEFLQQFPI